MSFEKGTFALSIFRLPEKMPEDTLELFSTRAAKKLDDLKTEEDTGWVSGRHLLERRIDEETAICGGSYYVYLRTAQRKIPAALLNAECRMLELNYIQENDVDFVPSKIRREIKENIELQRVDNMPPQITGIPLVIDRSTNLLYLGTGSTKSIDTFLTFFYETFQMEPAQIDIEDIMINHFSETPDNLPRISFSESTNEEDFIPGRDFLTWLWYFSEEKNGKITLDDYGSLSLIVDGPLSFALLDETGGAGETVLKKGMPQRSAEAKAALAVGKKLKKAKVTIVQGENIWSGTFDADKFCFSGLSLPEGEEMEMHSKFEERVNFLNIFRLALEGYFKTFVENIKSADWETEVEKIKKWSADRESL
jgi:recombination associated protein RdgC